MNRHEIRRIKAANKIIDVAKELGLEVSPQGMTTCFKPENHRHGDETPSMRLNAARNRFKCHACGEVKGDVVDLVAHVKGCSFQQALTWLAERAGLPVPRPGRPAEPPEQRGGVAASRRALAWFGAFARDGCGDGALDYLEGRGISAEVVKRRYIGYVDDYSAIMAQVAREIGVKGPLDPVFKAAGLTAFFAYERAGVPFVTFPYFDEAGQCCAIKARPAGPVTGYVPRFIATGKDIPVPYNVGALKSGDRVFVAEGEIDALTLETHGYPTVGIPGAKAFKKDWTELFLGKRVYLAFDGDLAGYRGARSVAKLLAGVAASVARIELPLGADVNDFFLTGGHHDE